jgi:hypothetical protein
MALRLEAGLVALLGVAYTIGAPDISPNLPRPMEMAFAKLHRDFNDIGRNAYYSTVQITSQVNLPSLAPQRTASANAPEAQ